jgi:hypothetical protein
VTPDPYENFKSAILYALKHGSAEPVRFRGMRVVDMELYFVVNYTTQSLDGVSRKATRYEILSAYYRSINWHDTDTIAGKAPVAMRILEINDTDHVPKSAYVPTSATRRWINGSLSSWKFIEIVELGTRNQTARERTKVTEIDRAWENRTLHNESYDPCC